MIVRAFSCFLATAGFALAEQPLSAIDWLSQDAATPTALPAPVRTEEQISEGAAIAEVTVSTLGKPEAGGTGLLPSDRTGLPKSLWEGSEPLALRAQIRLMKPSDLPALNRLGNTLLLAEARPPQSGVAAEAFLITRAEQLTLRGQVEQALALLEAAGPGSPRRFQQRFDAAILAGQEDRACRELVQGKVQASLPIRVFCLARTGDWNAAALTLETARSLGQISTDEDRLLASFLDAGITEETPARLGVKPTPLVFAIYDATGEPLATGPLPLPFAYADLRPTAGWKAQIDAAERLARAGAMDGNRLAGIYGERRPSASGGVWERARAVRAMDAALSEGDDAAIAAALETLWEQMSPAGTLASLAPVFAPQLADVTLTGRAAVLRFELGLLTEGYEAEARKLGADAPREAAFLAGLAQGVPDPALAGDATARAIAAAWSGDTVLPHDLTALPGANRLGEALVRAIFLVEDGIEGNPQKLTEGLAFLRSVGLEDTARRAALEALILRPAA